jgi:hypothetical protein
MDTQAELKYMQSLLLDRLSSAISNRDFAAVAALSGLAKECEALEAEFASLTRRVEAAKSALNGFSSWSTTSQKLPQFAEAPTVSPKAAGAQARNEWVAGLPFAARAQERAARRHKVRRPL